MLNNKVSEVMVDTKMVGDDHETSTTSLEQPYLDRDNDERMDR